MHRGSNLSEFTCIDQFWGLRQIQCCTWTVASGGPSASKNQSRLVSLALEKGALTDCPFSCNAQVT